MENYDNPELGAEIKRIRGELNQKEFGKSLGVSQGTVSKYEKGMMPEIPVLKMLAEIGNTTIDKLLSLKLENDSETGVAHIQLDPFIAYLNDNFVKMRMYHISGAGNEMVNVEFEPVGEIVIPKHIYKPNYVPMKVIGESMEKLIMNLSIVMVDTSPSERLIDKKIYCFRIPYSGFIIRQANTEPDGLYLEPFNKQFNTTKIDWSDFDPEIVVGRIVCNLINNIG